jgi:hypothetical protein
MISAVPEGFRRLALARQLSVECIGILHRLGLWFDADLSNEAPAGHTRSVHQPLGYRLLKLHHDPTVLRSERRLCLAVSRFEQCWTAISPNRGRPRGRSGRVADLMRDQLNELIEGLPQLGKEVDADFLIWTVMTISIMSDESSLSPEERQTFLRRWLQRCPRMKDWDQTLVSLKQYFWNEPLISWWHAQWKEACSNSIHV